jgi:hypothetical protein
MNLGTDRRERLLLRALAVVKARLGAEVYVDKAESTWDVEYEEEELERYILEVLDDLYEIDHKGLEMRFQHLIGQITNMAAELEADIPYDTGNKQCHHIAKMMRDAVASVLTTQTPTRTPDAH